jgi:peptidoglycan/LPS O-acetylase OafA/YrhL
MGDSQCTPRYRWPAGLANQISLVAALGIVLVSGSGLVAALVAGHRAHMPRPWAYDIAMRTAALAFDALLLLVRSLRERYPHLLVGCALGMAAGLFLRAWGFAASEAPLWVTLAYFLMWMCAGIASARGLLLGERLDELLGSLTACLLRAALGERYDEMFRR